MANLIIDQRLSMGLPSKRRTKSSKRRRASHFALGHHATTPCSSCGKPVLTHRVCLACGKYNGRQVLTVSSKAEKKLRKREKERAKAEKVPEKETK